MKVVIVGFQTITLGLVVGVLDQFVPTVLDILTIANGYL